jgi:hypothetical protein
LVDNKDAGYTYIWTLPIFKNRLFMIRALLDDETDDDDEKTVPSAK